LTYSYSSLLKNNSKFRISFALVVLYLHFILAKLKVKYSPLISQASGAIGDAVAACNRYGSYMRARNGPLPSGSAYWEYYKLLLQDVVALWEALSLQNKLQWVAASQSIPRSYAFGERSTLPGYNYFLSVNMNLLMFGLASLDLPPVHSNCEMPSSVSLLADVSAPSLVITVEDNSLANVYAKVFVTPSLAAGKTFFKNDLRLLKLCSVSVLNSFELYPEFLVRFPTGLVSGSNVFCKVEFFNSVVCNSSQPLYSSVSLVA